MAKQKEDLELKELEYDADGISIIDGNDIVNSRMFSSGSLGLDILTMGVGPGVIQMWGPDGIGKTTLLLIMAGEFQSLYGYENCRVYLHATEGRFNPLLCRMAPKLKMESPKEKDADGKPRPIFRVSFPKSGEKMYDFALKTLKQDKLHFFHIVDSSDGIKCEANEGKTMSDNDKTAATASLNTKFLREASVYMNHYGHNVAYTHQVRDKISSAPTHVSGVGKQKSGGHMVDHSSNLRLAFDKLWSELYIYENPNDKQSKIIGHYLSVKLEKCSTSGNPFAKAKIPFIYNMGIDRVREVFEIGIGFGIIAKDGNTYSYSSEKIAVGEAKALDAFRKNASMVKAVEKKIMDITGLK